MQWLAMVSYSKKVLPGYSVRDLSMWFPHVLGFPSGYSGFLHGRKTCKLGISLIVHSKLSVDVNVTEDGCLSLSISPLQ